MKRRFLFLLFAFLLWQTDAVQALTAHEQQPGTTGELHIRSGKESIYGILSKPANKGEKQPVVIIVHGFNGTHEFGKNYFKRLNGMGYQCFTFDFPCGSLKNRSNDDTMNMSVIDEQQHLEAVVDFFRSQPDVDPERIILVGESQGGLVSALTAAKNPTKIYRLVLVFPALCIPDNWNQHYPHIADIPDTTRIWNVPLGRRFFTEIRYLNPFALIGSYERPVLIIHGDKDPVVPLEYSVRASKTYKNASIVVLEGEGHGFKPQGFERSLDEIEKFLKD